MTEGGEAEMALASNVVWKEEDAVKKVMKKLQEYLVAPFVWKRKKKRMGAGEIDV